MQEIATIGLTVALHTAVTLVLLYVLYKKWVLPTIREYVDGVPNAVGGWIGNFKGELLGELTEVVDGMIMSLDLDGKLKSVEQRVYGAVGGHTKQAKTILNRVLSGNASEEEIEALRSNPAMDMLKGVFKSIQDTTSGGSPDDVGAWK